jgi:hypothetical protein
MHQGDLSDLLNGNETLVRFRLSPDVNEGAQTVVLAEIAARRFIADFTNGLHSGRIWSKADLRTGRIGNSLQLTTRRFDVYALENRLENSRERLTRAILRGLLQHEQFRYSKNHERDSRGEAVSLVLKTPRSSLQAVAHNLLPYPFDDASVVITVSKVVIESGEAVALTGVFHLFELLLIELRVVDVAPIERR